MRLDQIFVRAVAALDEGRRDLVLAGLDEHGIGEQRRRAAAIGGDLRTVLIREQRHTLTVDRNVDVFEARVVAVGEGHFEGVLAVGREHVIDDHAAARAIRRALDVIPRMLRHVGLVRVGLVDRRRVLVADRHAADVTGGVEIRVEQRRRQRLFVGDVVEVRAHRVLRQPLRRIHVDVQQVLDRARVLRAIQARERAAARIRIRFGVRVDRRLERADETLIDRGIGTRHARRRHHARLQLPDDALSDVGVLARFRNVERCERETAGAILIPIVVAADAVLLDEAVVVRRRGGRRCSLRVRHSRLRCNRRGFRCRRRLRFRRGRLCCDRCDDSQTQCRGAKGE